jgi:nucleoside-diphosphate-sugar epimerase
VAIFSGNLAEGRTSTINGTGEQTRDYVYVEDVARANVLAWRMRSLPEHTTSAPARRAA